MPPEGVVTTQAIGHVPTMRRTAKCMFYEAPLENEGAAFLDHIEAFPSCRQAYESWLENLNLDRVGG